MAHIAASIVASAADISMGPVLDDIDKIAAVTGAFLSLYSIGCMLFSLCQYLIQLLRYFGGPGWLGYQSWNSLSFCGLPIKFSAGYQTGSGSYSFQLT